MISIAHMKRNDKIPVIIYGAGGRCMDIKEFLKINSDAVDIAAIVDRDKAEDYEGTKTISPHKLLEYDKSIPVVIAIGPQNISLIKDIDAWLSMNGFVPYWSVAELFMDKFNALPRVPPYRSLDISTSIGCPVACTYCPHEIVKSSYEALFTPDDKQCRYDMSFDLFKKCIDKLPENTQVSFSGFVEPFIAPDSIDMLLYAREKGHKLELNTTLVGVTEENFEKILSLECSDFHSIILHFPDLEGNANIPVTKNHISMLARAFTHFYDCLKRSDGKIVISYHGSQIHPEVMKAIDGLRGGCGREFVNNVERPSNRGNVIRIDGFGMDMRKREPNLICTACTPSSGYWTLDDKLYLSANVRAPVLLPNGFVSFCSVDFKLKHIVGNLLTDDFPDLFNARAARYVNLCRSLPEVSGLCRLCPGSAPDNHVIITREEYLKR